MALEDWRFETTEGIPLSLMNEPEVQGPVSFGLSAPTATVVVANDGGHAWNPAGTGILTPRKGVKLYHRDALVFTGEAFEFNGEFVVGGGDTSSTPVEVTLKATPHILTKRLTDTDRFYGDDDLEIVRHLLGEVVLQRERFEEVGSLRTLTSTALEDGELVLLKDPDSNLYPESGECIGRSILLRGPGNEPEIVRMDTVYEKAEAAHEEDEQFETADNIDPASTGVVDYEGRPNAPRARAADRIETVTDAFDDATGTLQLNGAKIEAGSLTRNGDFEAFDDLSGAIPADWTAVDAPWGARVADAGAMKITEGAAQRVLPADVARGSVEIEVESLTDKDGFIAFYEGAATGDLAFAIQLVRLTSTSVDAFIVRAGVKFPGTIGTQYWNRFFAGNITLPERLIIRWDMEGNRVELHAESGLLLAQTGCEFDAVRRVRLGALVLETTNDYEQWSATIGLPPGVVLNAVTGGLSTTDVAGSWDAEAHHVVAALGGRVWFRELQFPNARLKISDTPSDVYAEGATSSARDASIETACGAKALKEKLSSIGSGATFPGWTWPDVAASAYKLRVLPSVAGSPPSVVQNLEGADHIEGITLRSGTNVEIQEAGVTPTTGAFTLFIGGNWWSPSSQTIFEKTDGSNGIRVTVDRDPSTRIWSIHVSTMNGAGAWDPPKASVPMTSNNGGEFHGIIVRRSAAGVWSVGYTYEGVVTMASGLTHTITLPQSGSWMVYGWTNAFDNGDLPLHYPLLRTFRLWASDVSNATLANANAAEGRVTVGGEVMCNGFCTNSGTVAATSSEVTRSKTSTLTVGSTVDTDAYGVLNAKEHSGSVVFDLVRGATWYARATAARDGGVTVQETITVGTPLERPTVRLAKTGDDETTNPELLVAANGHPFKTWWQSGLRVSHFEAYAGHTRPALSYSWTSIQRTASHPIRRARLTWAATTPGASSLVAKLASNGVETTLTPSSWVDLPADAQDEDYSLAISATLVVETDVPSVQSYTLEVASGYEGATTLVKSIKVNAPDFTPELVTVRPVAFVPTSSTMRLYISLDGGTTWRQVRLSGESFTPSAGSYSSPLDVRWKSEGENGDTATTWELRSLYFTVESSGGYGTVTPYVSTDDGASWLEVKNVEDDVLGWWKFEDASGSTANDESSGNRDGTLQGGCVFATDADLGACIQVPNDGAVSMASYSAFRDRGPGVSKSMRVRVKMTSMYAAGAALFATSNAEHNPNGSGYWWGVAPDGRMFLELVRYDAVANAGYRERVYSTLTVPLNEVADLGVAYDGGTHGVQFTISGADAGSGTFTDPDVLADSYTTKSNQARWFGDDPGGTSSEYRFIGYAKDAMYWARALTIDEFATLHDHGYDHNSRLLPPDQRGRKLAWKLALGTVDSGATPRVDDVRLTWACLGYDNLAVGEANVKVQELSLDFIHMPVANALASLVDATRARVRWRLDPSTEKYLLDYNYAVATWTLDTSKPTHVKARETDTRRERVKVVG